LWEVDHKGTVHRYMHPDRKEEQRRLPLALKKFLRIRITSAIINGQALREEEVAMPHG